MCAGRHLRKMKVLGSFWALWRGSFGFGWHGTRERAPGAFLPPSGTKKKNCPPWRRPRRLTPDSVHSVLKGTQSKGTQHTVWENTLSIPWRSSSSLPARKAPHGGNAFLPCDISTSG